MAKYLTVDLRDDKNILSHLFLNCLTPDIIDNIQKKRANNPEAEPEKEKMDITVWIEGVAVDPKPFFDMFNQQFEDIVKRAASVMVMDQVSDKFNSISNKLSEFEEITKGWAADINWDIPDNPFEKADKTKNSWNRKEFKEEMRNAYNKALEEHDDDPEYAKTLPFFDEWFEETYK